ncbi:DUF4402 domain-containing protein [Lacisediminimonas sp.]|uniref:DUF4402 domain-containing protein n=1 Tax=Lacisediminimonas sp. TaxID=3060582 RepID=UPI00271EADF1|nr:DUF4402 domain-containing protein [Lacisediminimonas sp.]MDO8301294.1 DUF4402 domain-containing protein [Lacisediminimonas sp.]
MRENEQSNFQQRAIKLALASIFAFGTTVSGYSFAAADSTTATGTVVAPIAITKATDLVFGKFAPGAGGTVTVSTSGTRTASGAILSTVGSSPTAAKFDVTGDNNATYSIAWGGVTALTNTTGVGAETMALTRISDLTGGGATTGEVTTGTLSASGAQSIYLGGVLTVAATQVAGVYTGNVTVTVEYN